MKKHSLLIFLGLALAVGLFLRAYKIESNYYFTGELGKELLYMRRFALAKTIPAIGMTTSHEWLSYGPFYYWLMIPVFLLFNGNPYILFWSAFAVAGAGLVLNFFVVRKIINQKVALVSTFIQSVSPLLIWQTRLAKLHVFFWILMPVLMLLAYKLWQGKKRNVFWAGLVFGILFSFHFSQIPIGIVFILIFLIKKSIYKFRDWLIFAAGVVIPNITLIWQDRDLALWLPYRIANLANKDPAGTLDALADYFGKNIFWNDRLGIIGLVIFTSIFGHYIYTNRLKIKTDFVTFYLSASIGIMVIANILHGAPPIHYFLPIFTTLPILYAIYLSKLKFWPIIIICVTFINLFFFTSDPVFYKSFVGNVQGTDLVSFDTQNAIVSFIVKDAGGKDFAIKRTGPFDYFPENYSQNYKYLILRQGGNLVDKSGNVYTIVEGAGGVHVQK